MRKVSCYLASVILVLNVYAQPCGSRQLDPGAAVMLRILNMPDLSVEQLRQTPIEQIKYAGPPAIPFPKEDCLRTKITADSIPVLVFNPSKQRNGPVIIQYHGGGFISPLLPGLEHELWTDAKTYNAVLFAVDYRVAPEHKYPAAVDDAYRAFQWITEHGGEFGGDTARIVLMGNSAGANLAAVVAQRAKKDGIAGKIKLQVLNGLPADNRQENIASSVSYRENEKGYFLTKAFAQFALETYAPGQAENPEVSPALAKDLQGLPPALIINAEFDPLRDDGILYAAKLRHAGVKVWDKCFAGQIHCLLGLLPGAPALTEMQEMVKTAMKECFPK